MHDNNSIYLYRENGNLHAIVNLHNDLSATILIFSAEDQSLSYIVDVNNIAEFINRVNAEN